MIIWQPPSIYLYRDAVDFRKSINGLALIVEQELGRSPFYATLFFLAIKTEISSKRFIGIRQALHFGISVWRKTALNGRDT